MDAAAPTIEFEFESDSDDSIMQHLASAVETEASDAWSDTQDAVPDAAVAEIGDETAAALSKPVGETGSGRRGSKSEPSESQLKQFSHFNSKMDQLFSELNGKESGAQKAPSNAAAARVTSFDSNDTLDSLYSNPLLNIAPASKKEALAASPKRSDRPRSPGMGSLSRSAGKRNAMITMDLGVLSGDALEAMPKVPFNMSSSTRSDSLVPPNGKPREWSPAEERTPLSAQSPTLATKYKTNPVYYYGQGIVSQSSVDSRDSTSFLALKDTAMGAGARRESREDNVWPGMRKNSADTTNEMAAGARTSTQSSNEASNWPGSLRDKKVGSMASSETSSSNTNLPFGKVESGKKPLINDFASTNASLPASFQNDPLLRPMSPLKPSRVMELLKSAAQENGLRSGSGYEGRRSLDSNAHLAEFRRQSQLKILAESPQRSLGIIQEQNEDHDSLKRTLSWPGRRDSLRMSVQQSESMDTAIFSTFLLKKNRRGAFQKRAATGTVRKSTVIDMDLIECPYPTIQRQLQVAVRECYPPGSTASSLARGLIALGTGTSPDAQSHTFLWVIPVDQIVKVETRSEGVSADTAADKTFTIFTAKDKFTFQAYTMSELTRIKYLLDTCRQFTAAEAAASHPQVQSDSAQVSISQQASMKHYLNQQANWKRVLQSIVNTDETIRPSVTTIKLEATGMRNMRGVVIQPPAPPSRTEESKSPIPAPRHSRFRKQTSTFESTRRSSALSQSGYGRPQSPLPEPKRGQEMGTRLRTSQDISAQIEALDREIALLHPEAQEEEVRQWSSQF
ncbi:hypothetical protein HDU91_000348 [Kappamyces sp. JEL0680]|nr:hypothetical protein HDU91_000348 [Kappamyces sp. JEL0680]